ncbi:MAG: SpoIIE family protein phosphatase [Verrucomicrobiales bacterium]|jgi:sigma-B regulation protein RsbU (phosphoserine phosphatase)|nr:SpoIIE family protein phosphatase [Verrucomicrobiales bacterium]
MPISPFDNQMLTALMANIPDPVYFKDLEGRFLSVNPACARHLGIGDPTLSVGKTDFDFFLKEHAEEAHQDEQWVLTTGQPLVAKLEKETLPCGNVKWVSTTKIPLKDASGKIIGTCGISRDVTDEHEKNEKLREYAEQLAEKQNQIEEELSFATEIQRTLLPQEYPAFPPGAADSELLFAHRYIPSGQVGGDFFSIIPIGEHKAGIVLCDVMGHGVHAALITAMQRIIVDEMTPKAHSPTLFLEGLNRRLHEILRRLPTPIFITAIYATLDTANRQIRFANAGHPQPLHMRGNTVELLGNHIPATTLPLGMIEDPVYPTKETLFNPGDKLLLFTDGLCDLDADDEVNNLDNDTLLALVQKCSSLHGEEFLNALIDSVKIHTKQKSFPDDICLLSAEFNAQN